MAVEPRIPPALAVGSVKKQKERGYMNTKKLAASVAMAMSLTVGMSILPSDGVGIVNLAEARSDYYVGYDDYMNADMYIDTDSVKSWGTNGYGRSSGATVHWTNGKSHTYYACYNPSTGDYYFSTGAGGLHLVTDGVLYRFAVLCDQFTY